mgnify:FL=1
MIIAPEIVVTPDLPTIRFREPRDRVNLDIELPRILYNQGWGCGTYFHIQFMSHDKNKLLASALFVVSEEVETLHTSDSAYQPVTKTVFNRKAEQIGEWWHSLELTGKEKPKEFVHLIPNPEDIVDPPQLKATVTWNPGKKTHQVKVGDTVIYESPDKDLAVRVANGETIANAA